MDISMMSQSESTNQESTINNPPFASKSYFNKFTYIHILLTSTIPNPHLHKQLLPPNNSQFTFVLPYAFDLRLGLYLAQLVGIQAAQSHFRWRWTIGIQRWAQSCGWWRFRWTLGNSTLRNPSSTMRSWSGCWMCCCCCWWMSWFYDAWLPVEVQSWERGCSWLRCWAGLGFLFVVVLCVVCVPPRSILGSPRSAKT